jgi:riboflavin kinase/FMN adenylyltransferase
LIGVDAGRNAMKILTSIEHFGQIKKGCVLTIGNFDGVHVGHQEILGTARAIASEKGSELVVMTFEPHPVAVLYPDKAYLVLMTLPLKMNILRNYADDCLIVLEDNKRLLGLTPEDFIDRFLMETLEPSFIVEGEDFNFGADREGSIETLKQFGAVKGFEVVVVPTKQVTLSTGQIIKVSSTMIRYMLESGHVSDAAVALSRLYKLIGRIIPGKGKGKQLGFPTLNMEKPSQIIPAEGVYAGFVEVADTEENLLQKHDKMPAVFSIGQARTFGDEHPLLIEAHMLVKQIGDMTDNWIAMDFFRRLRSQHKFNSPEALAKQIAKDCEQARGILI